MASDSDMKYLLEMGFSEEKCKRALKVSNNNLGEALDWILVHGAEPDTDQASLIVDCKPSDSATLKLSKPDEATAGTSSQSEESQDAQALLSANSLKCDDCGALLKDEDFATLHAHKTGHVNFSQSTEAIKPKTKEEIEEQKRRLEQKLVKLREEKKKKEQEDEIEREKVRRKEGRQINEIKQKFHEDELKRIGEEKRREKIADAEYKKKLKEQIAADREAMKKEKESQNKASVAAAPVPVAAPQPVVQEKKDYDECRIQVRLTDGKTLQQTFRAKEQLAAVRLWVEMNRSDSVGKFNIMQTFPRKVYSEDDMMRTLVDLGLCPASSLVIAKV